MSVGESGLGPNATTRMAQFRLASCLPLKMGNGQAAEWDDKIMGTISYYGYSQVVWICEYCLASIISPKSACLVGGRGRRGGPN